MAYIRCSGIVVCTSQQVLNKKMIKKTMRGFILTVGLLIGFSTMSYSQSGAEKDTGEKKKKERGESRSGARKPRKQMQHFGKKKVDPNIRSNGTSYRMQRRKEALEAEGNGYGETKRYKQ